MLQLAVAEFHDSVIKIVLPFRYFRFPHPRSDLFEKCSQVRVADDFVDSVFIMVYNHGLL